MKTLYLVDASAMFFRAFFALPPLTSPDGMPTNALYGFYSMTQKLLKDEKPDHLIYCFDRKEPTFRNEIYPEYKANRDEMPEDLVPQVPYMRKFTDCLHILSMDQLGFEADDLIGSLAKQGEEKGYKVVIVSGDKDFAQLVTKNVTLLDTMKDKRTDIQGVVEKWGVRPDQIIDYLAICGDSSDNIPGVRGIGPKGAQKLLSEYETLENIYEHIEEIKPPGTQKKLKESRDNAFLSKELATIKTDMNLDVDWETSIFEDPNVEELRKLLVQLGFKTFVKNLEKTMEVAQNENSKFKVDVAVENEPTKSSQSNSSESYQLVDWSTEDIQKNLAPYSEISALYCRKGLAFESGTKIFVVSECSDELKQVLEKKNLQWSGYELKEVFKFLRLRHAQVKFDGQLAAHILSSDKVGGFEESLEKVLEAQVGDLTSWEEHFALYADLRKNLEAKVKESGMQKVLDKLEYPLEEVLASMELCGVKVDVEELKRQSETLTGDIQKLEKAIHEMAGKDFNVASPKQLSEILFTDLKLTPGRKTKTGFSTDNEVLMKLKAEHPIADLLIEYRELSKLKSTYVDAIPLLVDEKTKRVHTHLNQAATSTGRLSSTNPNLQNIPIRTARGREVRKAFVAEEGKVLISADYSQIELRILAHISEDKGLIEAFKKDQDIHTATASEIFNCSPEEVNAELRRQAKAVNFGIAYGQGVFGLADTLGIARAESKAIIERYFDRFPGVKDYMEKVVHSAYENGYVETLFGRKRFIQEIKSKNHALRKFGERAAINAPIQGTAADLVKLAMIEAHQNLPISLVLQVHDELIFECEKEDAESWSTEVKDIMENIFEMKVPLKVNVAYGTNWDDAH
ncbi:MAG: DNA polymerase I [Thioclava sp.]|nr:DNA polymerase I [Thioclava sp.]|tara:strand:+ start:483 stop:3044 length:2562 start_codon:yes stop_codon:yes gene_type:complete